MMIAFKKHVAFALAVSATIVLTGLGVAAIASQSSSNDFSHVVTREENGDIINVLEVRGPSDTITVGNTYEVRGTYKLVSLEKALLMVNVTVDGNKPHQSHPDLPKQSMIVEKGEGSFVLQFHMWTEGQPHLTFYPAKGGHGFAMRYF
jgi:protein-disulfide isomerase